MTTRGNVRDWARWLEGRCNWGWLVETRALGNGRISPTDIDFLVERNGYFLFGEVKPSRFLSEGQRILLDRLSRIPVFTVFVLVGFITDDHEIAPFELGMIEQGYWNWRAINRPVFAEFVRDWFKNAGPG